MGEKPRGIIATDVDKTLYRTTDAIKKGITERKLKPSINLFKAFAYWLLKKYKGRDWFSEKVDSLYVPILLENGPQRMEEFYRYVATNKELHHAGAIDLIQTAIKSELFMAFVSGNDRRFVEILLEENDISSEESAIYGAQFEIEDGQYTGKSEGTNTGSQMKDDIIKQIEAEYPDIPVIGAIGDDEADKSLFDASSKNGGFCIAVGDSPKLAAILEDDDFHLYTDMEKYLAAHEDRKVLLVTPYPQEGRATLQTVTQNFPRFLPPGISKSSF